MLKFPGFHFKKPILLSAAIMGLALIAMDASAQSETDKMEENTPRVNDRVILEDHASLQDNHSSPQLLPKPSTPAKLTPQQATVRRDLPAGGVENQVKKNESPSTLSFNIFLYVVDKFKAD